MNWNLNSTCSWIMKKIISYMDLFKEILCWKAVEQGKPYRTGHMYQALWGEKENVKWYTIMLNNLARQRTTFTLWMALHGKLPTKDRLIRLGIQIDPKCCIYDDVETLNHLLFECYKPKSIWSKFLKWVGIIRSPLDWNNEMDRLSMEGREKRSETTNLESCDCWNCVWDFEGEEWHNFCPKELREASLRIFW